MVEQALAGLDFDPFRTDSADIERRIREAVGGACEDSTAGDPARRGTHEEYISSILAELMADETDAPAAALDLGPSRHVPVHVEIRRLDVYLARGRNYLSATGPIAEPSLWPDGWSRQMAQGHALARYLDGVDPRRDLDPTDGLLLAAAAKLAGALMARLPAECDFEAPVLSPDPFEGMEASVNGSGAGAAEESQRAALGQACAAMRREIATRGELVAIARTSWKLGSNLLALSRELPNDG